MKKQFKKVALGAACAMTISAIAPVAQASYAGTAVYEVTLGTPERRTITEETLKVGETIDLNFYGVKDWNQNKANYKCKWTASNDAVTVNHWGVVTAVQGGTAEITLTVTDTVTGVSHNIIPATITVVAEETATPVPTSAPVVVPTEVPTEAPTVVPTEAPTVVPTEAPTVMPTEAPTATPTEVPTAIPTETPVAEASEFAAMLKELHSLDTYEERAAYVEQLDKSKYKVAEEASLDLITHADGIYLDVIQTYDVKTGDYTEEIAPDSRIHFPSFSDEVLSTCAGIRSVEIYEHKVGASAGERPTGENYLMTITDIATGETDPWGVKIQYAEAVVESVEQVWGMSAAKVAIDPDSPVKTGYCTVEELVNEKNSWHMDSYYDKCVTSIDPVYPQERYDEDWNPTGEYYFYETSKETVYVTSEDVQYDEWGKYYYCYDETGCFQNVKQDETGCFQNVKQDETGAYYYILEKEYEVSVKERGYTVVANGESGSYLVDKDGAVVTKAYEYTESYGDPNITTWDTLKHYQDVYDPRFCVDFTNTFMYQGDYGITDMKAEDYPHLSTEQYDSLKQRYMEMYDIVLDEEVLAIREEVKELGWRYEEHYDKEGRFSMSEQDDDGNYKSVIITVERPENWYFRNMGQIYLVVKDDSINENFPVHELEYYFSNLEVSTDVAGIKEEVRKYFARYANKDKLEDIHTMEVDGRPVYYVETTYYSDARSFCILQDIGLSKFVWIEITSTYDMETDAEKLIGQFLLDDNYTITRE